MVLELVTWNIKAGFEHEFELAFDQAQVILSEMDGYLSHQLQKCIEEPGRYILLVHWNEIEDHTEGFQKSGKYQEYRSLIKPYYEPNATLEHYEVVFDKACLLYTSDAADE